MLQLYSTVFLYLIWLWVIPIHRPFYIRICLVLVRSRWIWKSRGKRCKASVRNKLLHSIFCNWQTKIMGSSIIAWTSTVGDSDKWLLSKLELKLSSLFRNILWIAEYLFRSGQIMFGTSWSLRFLWYELVTWWNHVCKICIQNRWFPMLLDASLNRTGCDRLPNWHEIQFSPFWISAFKST